VIPLLRLIFLLVVAWGSLVASGILSAADTKRPNLVLIVADDLGYGELGCYGGEEIPTPHLDSLAASGVRYTDGYVTAPFCAASRAGLMTGQYQTRFGFEFNPIGAKNCQPDIGLPRSEPTIAEVLRDAGYATGLVGKWHLGGTAEYHPQRRGFDEFFGFLHEGHYFVSPDTSGATTWLRRKLLPDGGLGRWVSPSGRTIWSTHMGHNEPPYDTNNPLMRSSQPVDESEHLTDAFSREACRFIARHDSQPFFLCLTYNAVHSPLQAEAAYLQRFASLDDIQRRIFAAMLSHLDDGVGRVLAALDEYQLRSNTLVVFLSDNGGPTKELTSSNRPLRGGKGNLYEGGIRVPFLLSWPGHIPVGVHSQPVSSLDVMATAVDLVGKPQRDWQGDGKSLLPIADGVASSASRASLFWRVGQKHAVRHGDWKLIRNGGDWELFDLATDVSESHDLAADYPDRVDELAGLWQDWSAEQIEPLWK